MSNPVALRAQRRHDFVHVLPAGRLVRGLRHHADHRLGARLAHQDAAAIAQGGGCLLHRGPDGGVAHGGLFVGHAHIFQHLRVNFQGRGQLAQLFLAGQHHLHHLEAGQDAVAGGGVLREDDVARLLPADAAAVLGHVLVDVFVAHGGLGVADARLVQRLVQAEVGHDGGHDGVADQLAALLHIAAVDVEDGVAVHDVPLLVHAEAAVGVAVVGEAHVEALLHHELLQPLDVGGPGVQVDVQAVGAVVDDVGVRAEGVEDGLGDVPARAVGAVEAHLHPLEGVDPQRDEVAHVAVAAGDVVHRAADALAARKRQLGPVLVKHVQLAVEVILNQKQRFFVHLLAAVVDELDAVVVVGVVAGRDHDAAVEVVHPRDVGHARRGGDVQQVGVRPGCHQAAHQRVLEHIRAAPGVLADHDAGRLAVAAALAQHPVVPPEKAPDLVGVVSGEFHICFPAEAVGAEIFSHINTSLSFIRSIFSPHHLIHNPCIALDDLHHLIRHVLVGIVRHGDAEVAAAVHLDRHVHGLQQAGGVDAGQDKAALVQRLGALGAGADADGREGPAHAGEKAALLRQGARVRHHAEGVHLQAVVVVEAQRLVLNDTPDRHIVRFRHFVDGGEQRQEIFLGIDVFLAVGGKQDVPPLLEAQPRVDVRRLDLGEVFVQHLRHGRAGDVGALFGQAGVRQVAAGVLGVGHVHVRDDVHNAAVGLLGQALVLAAVACLHVEDGDVQPLCADDRQTAIGVAQHQHRVGPNGGHQLVALRDDVAHRLAEVRAHRVEVDLRVGQLQVAEEDAVQVVVVVLAGVGQDHVEIPPRLVDHRRQPDDLGPGAHDDEQLEFAVVFRGRRAPRPLPLPRFFAAPRCGSPP